MKVDGADVRLMVPICTSVFEAYLIMVPMASDTEDAGEQSFDELGLLKKLEVEKIT